MLHERATNLNEDVALAAEAATAAWGAAMRRGPKTRVESEREATAASNVDFTRATGHIHGKDVGRIVGWRRENIRFSFSRAVRLLVLLLFGGVIEIN